MKKLIKPKCIKKVSFLLIGSGLFGVLILWILSNIFIVPDVYVLPISQHPDFVHDLGIRGNLIAFARYYKLFWLVGFLVALTIVGFFMLVVYLVQNKKIQNK